MPSITEALTDEAAEYALKLADAGFTVYVPTSERRPFDWFHYSREVDGKECFGTFYMHSSGSRFDPPSHSMPITPSRLNGSSAIIGATWGDLPTLGLDTMDPMSVEYAMAVARPANWCPYCAPPSAAPHGGVGAPRSAFSGTRLPNAKPWGIGEHYVKATR